MTMAVGTGRADRPVSWINDPNKRALVFQVVLAVVVLGTIAWLTNNTIENMRRTGLTSGFDYLAQVAGFPISQRPVDYVVGVSSYARALSIGFLNTLIVAAIGIVLTTILGFTIGIARLSSNWLIAKIATVYVETIRNIPLLLQLLFWYTILRLPMPAPKQSFNILDAVLINQRGFYFPEPKWGEGILAVVLALIIGIVATVFYTRWANRRQEATGRRPKVLLPALGLIVLLPILVFLAAGSPLTFDYPALKGFNVVGASVGPEFVALLLGLTIYTASFIAEIVRGGIRAVSHGQTEAARALGLPTGRTLRLVVIPQAVRVIIPPLTNQYLNLTKNSSLAHFIGYPDLVLVNETVMNQTNRSIEGIAIVMSIYLILSLLTALFMNWFNKRVALVER